MNATQRAAEALNQPDCNADLPLTYLRLLRDNAPDQFVDVVAGILAAPDLDAAARLRFQERLRTLAEEVA